MAQQISVPAEVNSVNADTELSRIRVVSIAKDYPKYRCSLGIIPNSVDAYCPPAATVFSTLTRVKPLSFTAFSSCSS